VQRSRLSLRAQRTVLEGGRVRLGLTIRLERALELLRELLQRGLARLSRLYLTLVLLVRSLDLQ